ncbi:hypothetical protein [uncultured Tenacibaculum sp.]|uniref:hypothetical protein n=1 Tax=uncultured Tenacibaculum sp. TaxID=174713 RepID=UPI00260D3A4D|nr:hypothetical protein [uncultured Tenacibaculum sp.]
MGDILKLARIQILFIVLFAFFKFIRPPVLKSNAFDWIKIALLSLPNFFEGVIGVLTLTAMLLYLNSRFLTKKQQVKEFLVYGIALILAGIYVITQEFKIHNLGGENVYDKNDVIFSIIGLTVGYLIIVIYKPRIN